VSWSSNGSSAWLRIAFVMGMAAAGNALLVGSPAGGSADRALMPRLAEREFVRSEFDRDRVLIGRQEVRIGPLERNGDRTSFTAWVKAFDGRDQLREEAEVRVDCNVEEPAMLMGLVDLLRSGSGGGIDIQVDAASSLRLVPSDESDSLADFRLTFKPKGGWRGLVGGRKLINVRNRRVARTPTDSDADSSRGVVRIREVITVSSHVLGIRLGSKTYRGLAEYDAAGGLLHYELSAPDGSLSVIERRGGSPSALHQAPARPDTEGARRP